MPHRDDTSLRVGKRGGETSALAQGDGIAILVGDGGQAIVGAKEPLLSRTVIGQSVGVVMVVNQRGIDTRRTGEAAIGVVGEIGFGVAGAIQDDGTGDVALIQIHLSPQAQVPVVAHLRVVVGVELAVVVGVDIQVLSGAMNLHLDTVQNQVARSDIDQKFLLATGTGVQGMVNVGVEG